MTKKIYILVVTFNAVDWLDVCCAPFSSLPDGWKLVVIDNASTDGTPNAVRSLYPQAKLIASPVNLGFGRANNIGLRLALEAEADHVLLLNQDVDMSIEDVTTLAAVQTRFPEFFIASPVQLDGTGKNLDYSFAVSCLPKYCARLVKDALNGAMEDIYPSTTGTAAAWLLSRRCLETIGGFSPAFLHYGEDDNYLSRVLYHGFKLGIVPSVFARHHRPQSPKKKPLGRSYTDRVIQACDLGFSTPGSVFFMCAYMQAARCFLKGESSLGSFIMQNHVGFLHNPLRAAREVSKKIGPTFLD